MTEFEARSRWSMAVRCPRMGAYAMRGADPAEPDEIQRGYFLRGKQIGSYVADRFAEQYGEDQIIREKPIPWPAGIAHGDVYVKPERLAVEVKSTASLVPLDYHLLQLAGQILFDPDADHGALVLVNPSNLLMRTLPMPVVPDELADQVHDIAAKVAKAADPAAPLPDRCCAKPSDAFSRQCPFVVTCFTGWEPPEPVDVVGEVARLVAELKEIEDDLRGEREQIKATEVRRDTVRAQLRRTIEPATEYVSPLDELAVRITPVDGRVTWDVATAIKMGAVREETLEPFRKVGRPYERWTVKPRPELMEEPAPERVLAGLAADDDYGDVPF